MSADTGIPGLTDASPSAHFVDSQSNDGSSASNGVSAMTIEFLRARLLSERAASKSARQHVQQLSLKLSELQARLDLEVAQRKQAQDSMERMLKFLRAKGLPVECLEKSESEIENLESIKEVDDHGTASERSVTKHEVMSSPRCHQCNQTLLASNVQPSSIDNSRDPNPSPEECYAEEPHHGSPVNKDRRRHPWEAEEVCPNDRNTRNETEIRGRDEKMQPTEIPDRLESASFKLKSMLHQIVQEINTLPKDQPLKVQLKDWADNVIQLCDDKTLHGLESEGERCDSSHREKGMDCSKAGESLCSSMNEKRDTAVDDTKEDVQNAESQRASQQRRPNDVQDDAVGGSVSEQSMLHDKSSEYMRGKWPHTVGAPYSGEPVDGVVTGRHNHQDSSCRDWHEVWSPHKPDAGYEAMPCDIYRKQDVVYRNLETHHGYVCDVWHRDRVISTRNAKGGHHHHHQSLMDDKNGRLGDILNALQEARQYVDDAGRSEGPYVGEGFCAPQVLLPHAEEDFYSRGNHERRRNPAQAQPPPIIHLPSSSPISDRGAPPTLPDRLLLMRSRSVSSSIANFSHLDHHRQSLRPAREVQLGNGITLYTD